MSNDNKTTPGEKFEAVLRKAAETFINAQPLSVPKAELMRTLDRTVAAFRAMAASKPVFYECSIPSLARCMALSAMSGLVPGGPSPQVDLIPRKKRFKNDAGRWVDSYELDWQIGFRGYLALAARAGVQAKVQMVFHGEDFVWEEGLDEKLVHRPNPGLPEFWMWDGIHVGYIVLRRPDGTKDFLVLPKQALEQRREQSQAWRTWSEWFVAKENGKPLAWPDGREKDEPDCPWVSWPIEMALKTVVRYAAQRGAFVLDEVGAFVAAQDAKLDVIEGEPVKRPVVRPAALPDFDPLGMNDATEREREKVPVGRGANDDLARFADDGDTNTNTKPEPKPEEKPRDPILDQLRMDAKALFEAADPSTRKLAHDVASKMTPALKQPGKAGIETLNAFLTAVKAAVAAQGAGPVDPRKALLDEVLAAEARVTALSTETGYPKPEAPGWREGGLVNATDDALNAWLSRLVDAESGLSDIKKGA